MIEVPICLATAIYWLAMPEDFLMRSYGVLAPDAGHRLLVLQGAGILVSILVWFYGRWLLSARVELRAFRLFQEGLLLGDLFLVAWGIMALSVPGASAVTALAQVVMASLWGLIRVVFLYRTSIAQ